MFSIWPIWVIAPETSWPSSSSSSSSSRSRGGGGGSADRGRFLLPAAAEGAGITISGIDSWEEKMLARQKKQEAAVAAVHKALSTKLAGAQADGEAEARRVHERSESAVRKAVAELTAASHRSKSRLEEATKEILQQCAAAFRDIEKKKNDTLRKAKGGHKKALAQVASLISRMEAAGAASEGDMSD